MSNVWTKYKAQHWLVKVLIVLAIWFLLANLALLAGKEGSSNSPGTPVAAVFGISSAGAVTQPGPCPSCPNSPVNTCTADPEWCLSQGVEVDEDVVDAGSIILDPVLASPTEQSTASLVSTTALTPKCHGRVYRRKYIKQPITGFVYGWRQTAISWCYGSNGVITSTVGTGNDGSYSGGLWCFKDINYGKAWWNVSHTEVKVWNTGVLYTCVKALPLTRTLNPMIFAHGGTRARPYPYWNYGDPTKVYH